MRVGHRTAQLAGRRCERTNAPGAWVVLLLRAVAASSAPPGPRAVSAGPIFGMPSRGAGWLRLGPRSRPRIAMPRTLAAANLGGSTPAIEIGEGESRNGGGDLVEGSENRPQVRTVRLLEIRDQCGAAPPVITAGATWDCSSAMPTAMPTVMRSCPCCAHAHAHALMASVGKLRLAPGPCACTAAQSYARAASSSEA
jgi:hypothetical protein